MWQTSRFELKYMVPHEKVELLRHWIHLFLQPDRFSAMWPDRRYAIGSLYLDSADLHLFRTTECGHKNRFKLRIRSYSDAPSSPVFLEIKRRLDRTIRKSRVMLERTDARDLLTARRHACNVAEGTDRHHLETFLGLVRSVAAGPVVRVRYRREAYESPGTDTLRLTLDEAITYCATPDYDFSLESGCWQAVPMGGVLLEIKFTDCFPPWVLEMVRSLELDRIPFSKYGGAVHGMRKTMHAPPTLAGGWLG